VVPTGEKSGAVETQPQKKPVGGELEAVGAGAAERRRRWQRLEGGATLTSAGREKKRSRAMGAGGPRI